jgi:hypothetical protein
LLGLFLWPAATGAQQQLATLQGTITDQSGAIVPGVTVIATSVDTGAPRTAMTNEAGVYSCQASSRVATGSPPS